MNELTKASKSDDIEGVILLITYSWYSVKEWNVTNTYYER